MGLASLLKRKLNKDDSHSKGKKAKTVQISRETAAEIAKLKSQSTRTAKRKLQKFGALAELDIPVDLVQANDTIDAVSEDEIDATEEAANGLGTAAHAVADPTGAYEALLSSLAGSNEDLAGAVELRRRELAGDSEEEDSEEDMEDLEEDLDGAAEEEEEGVDSDVLDDEDRSEEEEEEEDAPMAENEAEKQAFTSDEQTAASCDYCETHLEMQLSEDALAHLAATRPNAAFVNLEDVSPSTQSKIAVKKALNQLQAWLPKATVQATVGASLPAGAPLQLKDYGIRERLINRWKELHSEEDYEKKGSEFVSQTQRAFFSMLSSYCDVLHPCRPYSELRELDSPDPEMDAVLLHLINHVARTSDRIKKNNEKLGNSGSGDPDLVPRDQGFTRPKVLILLPMRNIALKVVSRLLKLALRETRTDSIQNKERFLEEFGAEDEEDEEAGLSARAKAGLARKPMHHRALFAGNLDDHFRLGIKLTRGAVRLYSDFYQSDVLVCSPLALATKLSEGDKEGSGAADFLSSIEIVVLERADVLQMQNWSHVVTVIEALNKMPAQQRDVDIMRVREWYLAGQARHYRQTILLSSFATAEMNALLGRKCENFAGQLRLIPSYSGVLGSIVPQVRQTFDRISIPAGAGPAGDPDARFEYFKKVTWPRIRESARGGGQLIYIPSYFDFVRVRNFLRAESASFLGLCEYTERKDMARARSYFADGRRRVLLYTERAQFYNRHGIRGTKDILFYQLPEHSQFYSELVNFLEEGSTSGVGLATCTVMYSKYDVLRLERVVGSERAKLMLKKKSKTFLFC